MPASYWAVALAAGALADPPADDLYLIGLGNPMTKEGKSLCRTEPIPKFDANGQRVNAWRLKTRQELLAEGALPETIEEPETESTPTYSIRFLLHNANARKAIGFTADELASIPIAIEEFKALDAEFLKDPKARERIGDYRRRLDQTLRECFAQKGERLRQLMLRFNGFLHAVSDPLRCAEIGLSGPQFDAMKKDVGAWAAKQRFSYRDPMARKPDLTYEEILAVNARAHREIVRRNSLEENEFLRRMTAEQRANWAKMIGDPPDFVRPEPWHYGP